MTKPKKFGIIEKYKYTVVKTGIPVPYPITNNGPCQFHKLLPKLHGNSKTIIGGPSIIFGNKK